MFQRGKRIWRIALLALVLLWTASPGWAAAGLGQGVPLAGWTGIWERALAWICGGGNGSAVAPAHSSPAAGRQVQRKSSSSIDPLGQPVPASAMQSDSSSQIDPDGTMKAESSSSIDPNGRH
jgi:hypothetical protein